MNKKEIVKDAEKIKFGNKLKKLRIDNNLTQLELSVLTNYTSRSSIADIENGRNSIPLDKLELFAKALNVEKSELVSEQSITKANRDIEPTIEELRENLNTSKLIELDMLINLNLNTLQKKGDLEEKTKEELIKYLTKAFIESLENIKNNEKIGEIEYDVKNF